MKKQGIGLSLNGKELRVAHLTLEGGQVQILSLENTQLPAYMDASTSDESDLSPAPDINDPELLDVNDKSLSSDESESSADIAAQLVHSMINKYASSKIKVGLNVPTTDVSYQETTDVDDGVAEKKTWTGAFRFGKKSFAPPKKEFIIPRSDRNNLKVILESSTPYLLSLLERQNVFFKGHLAFSLMLPNELALVNLCRRCRIVTNNGDITIIIQVEDDFSHLIFLKGDELLWVTPFFTEFEGEALYNILYSKIIYELDHWQIDDIDKIFLASNAASEGALVFFQERMPGTLVDYIAPANNCGISSSYSREELSRYALSITLAWQTLAPFDKNYSWSNMLPQRILDSQKALRLSPAGVLLLCILGVATLASTWGVMKKQYTNNKLKSDNAYFEMQLKANEPIVEKVHILTEKISQLAQVTTLADSLIEAYDSVLTFLNQASHSLGSSNDMWVNQISNTETGFKIIGQSRKREMIPVLSSVLGKSVLRHVYQEYGGEQVYTFEIDLNWPSQPVLLPMPEDNPELQFAQQFGLSKKSTPDSMASGIAPGNSQTLYAPPRLGANLRDAKFYQSPAGEHGLFTIELEKIPDLETGREFVQQIQRAGYDVFIRRRKDQYFISTEAFNSLQDAEKKMLRLRQKNIPNAEIVEIDNVDTVAIDMPYADSAADPNLDPFAAQTHSAGPVQHAEPQNAGLAFEANDAHAPAIDEIKSDLPLGPPAPEEPIAIAESLSQPDNESLAAKQNSDSSTEMAASVDSQFQLAREDYFFNDTFDTSATVSQSTSESITMEESAPHFGNSSAIGDEPFAYSGDSSANRDESVAKKLSFQPGPVPGITAPEDDAVIPLHMTAKKEKIIVLASDHFFSDSALEETQQFRNYNIEATILDLRIQGKVKPFWVCLGEFDNKADAESVINLAKQRVDRNYKIKILDAGNFMPYQKPGASMM